MHSVARAQGTATEWQAGAFIDVGSLQSLNSPSNHLFRSRGTTPRVDELNVNMAGLSLRKKPTESSRWGVEVTGQGGGTTFDQTVTALTTTLEYRRRFKQAQTIFRFEHRYDHSTGRAGGFFEDVRLGVVGVTPGQHLLIFGLIVTVEGTFRN